MSALRAYPTLLRVGLASAIAYRVEMFVWMLTMTMPLVSLALWSAVSASTPVGRFGQGEFVAYFLATIIVRQLTGSWVVWELIQDIKSGALASRLLKPLHPLVAYSAENLAALPMRAVLALPMTTIALVARSRSPPPSARAHRRALPVADGRVVHHLLRHGDDRHAQLLHRELDGNLRGVAGELHAACRGTCCRLELFPAWVKDIAYLLPFRYTLGFPVEILIGMSSSTPSPRGSPCNGRTWSPRRSCVRDVEGRHASLRGVRRLTMRRYARLLPYSFACRCRSERSIAGTFCSKV